jgi:hypothetical protein
MVVVTSQMPPIHTRLCHIVAPISFLKNLRRELVRLGDNHRAGLQPLAGRAISPFIPEAGGGKQRRAIGRGEVPWLLPVRGVLPFVVARDRDQAAGTFERALDVSMSDVGRMRLRSGRVPTLDEGSREGRSA